MLYIKKHKKKKLKIDCKKKKRKKKRKGGWWNKDKKIVDFGRFFGEKSDFGGAGKDIEMEKLEKKNRRKIANFSDKNRFFLENFFF